MEDKVKVGQMLYRQEKTHRGVATGEIKGVAVTKVGNKYFYVDNGNTPYDMVTLRHTSKSSSMFDVSLYLSRQHILDALEYSSTLNLIQRKIQYTSGVVFSLDQLRRIKSIIEETPTPAT